MRKLNLLLLMSLLVSAVYGDTIKFHIGAELLAVNPDMPDLIAKAITKAGHNPSQTPTVYALRASELSSKGENHIELRIPSYAQEQDVLVPIKIPVSALKIRAFVNKSTGLTNITELKGKCMASVRGMSLNAAANNVIGGVEIKELSNFEQVVKFVQAGRAEFFINEVSAGKALVEKYGFGSDIELVEDVLLDIPLYVFIHKDKAAIIPDLEQALKEMYDAGEFQ